MDNSASIFMVLVRCYSLLFINSRFICFFYLCSQAIADTPSFIFLWVGDGVGLEQGRQCLKKVYI